MQECIEANSQKIETYSKIGLIKEAYIYPQDSCSELILLFFKDYMRDFKFDYVDDKESITSLEKLKETIIQDNKHLMICAGEVYDILFKKACNMGITKILDGREYMAFLLAQKFSQLSVDEEISRKFSLLDNQNVLYIHDNKWVRHYLYFYCYFAKYISGTMLDYLNQEVSNYCKVLKEKIQNEGYDLSFKNGIVLHFDSLVTIQSLALDKFLYEQGLDTLLYCWDLQTYEKFKEKLLHKKIIIAPWILCDYFTPRSLVWLYSLTRPKLSKNKKCVVGCGHHIGEALEFCAMTIKEKYFANMIPLLYLGFDYVLSIDKNQQSVFGAIFAEFNIPSKALEAGSPRLDTRIANHKGDKYGFEQFYYIPKSTETKKIIEVIKIFLSAGKKLVFRPHITWNALGDYKKEDLSNPYYQFLSHKNFIFDNALKISEELLGESIVITDNSSVAYSVPWVHCKPVLLYAPNKKEWDLKQIRFGYSFANEILHRVGETPGDLLRQAEQLQQDIAENAEKIRKEIQNYRKKTLLNLGKSQEAIEKILLELYKKSIYVGSGGGGISCP